MIRTTSSSFAARSLRVALAVAVLGLGAGVSVAAAKGIFARDAAAETVAVKQDCREVVVDTDEGYGVRGTVTRMVCRAAL
jgi:uncharacterized membrane protein YczE